MTDEKKKPEEDEVSDGQLADVAGGQLASRAAPTISSADQMKSGDSNEMISSVIEGKNDIVEATKTLMEDRAQGQSDPLDPGMR